ncbi:type I restriction endonuclease [uncultured Desulfovibrio sp.]|uniref:type I restriction endonuclease subunit R n=1 Tax=uncultured Desulfovibrio sp. TaxID=167968 RepID=UPI00260E760B|nr:type I restriction endonuclease [uncultured Desulfovibrio sp.]
MSDNLRERNFEDDICAWLCTHGGYAAGDPARFDRVEALDVQTLLDFVRSSQPKAWTMHERKNPGKAEKVFVDRFCKEVRTRSLLEVLRQGFKILGVAFRVVFWKPENDLNPETVRLYESNILHCTRQLRYSPANENSVDVALFVNGIPVVCLELKNPLTGQTVEDAVRQFRQDRSPDDLFFAFKRRVLTCFAVDPFRVRMTTCLAREKTYFLPFDQGSNGAGEVGGAGNPIPRDNDYATSYLWKKVLCKDSLLELLQKFLHLKVEEKKDERTGKPVRKESLIFPRYHQWDVLHKLLDDVRRHGAGRNYLVQHSAGSGKSNSIAWLAHRLSGLHDAQDRKIFQSVVIVTDRRVLDAQLQGTVRQFEQVTGLVRRIDKNSAQLRDALNEGAAIIVTTLQKFPVIFSEVEHGDRNFAVIVDEAHSSQTGRAALKLKRALADTEAALDEFAELEGDAERAGELKADAVWQELAAQGRHDNLSFFAFTATPKDKTLQLFGEKQPDGRFRAFHIYSMRQAIEEGFILDVLRNYTTYRAYFKLICKGADDPRYATAAGARAALRFESLHPHNISQKTAVMLEHFRTVTARKMGGRAKAMLVTPSRLHAVRYMQEFDRQIRNGGMTGIRALVAFSGEVKDTVGGKECSYTEEGLNAQTHGFKISERELPDVFAKEFNILIVAEKYQTGFDEPLLHTMFVDKQLSGVKAVQTLSRLNRTAPGKEDTFVLDFVNSAEDIRKAFEPFYEATVLEEEIDPNLVYDIRHRLDDFQVYSPADVAAFGAALRAETDRQGESALSAASAKLAPVLTNVAALPDDQRRAFRTGLARFVRLYNFVTQICRMFDEDMHIYSLFAKKLASSLPPENDGLVNLDGKIDLEYYKLIKTGEESITLTPSDKGFAGIKGDAGAPAQKEFAALSDIVDRINQRFGTQFRAEDQVHTLRQITERVARHDPRLLDLIREGNDGMWKMLYDKSFVPGFMDAALDNATFFGAFSTQDELDFLKNQLREQVRQFLLREIAGEGKNGHAASRI